MTHTLHCNERNTKGKRIKIEEINKEERKINKDKMKECKKNVN